MPADSAPRERPRQRVRREGEAMRDRRVDLARRRASHARAGVMRVVDRGERRLRPRRGVVVVLAGAALERPPARAHDEF